MGEGRDFLLFSLVFYPSWHTARIEVAFATFDSRPAETSN